MINDKRYEFCSEVYVVEKAIEVEVEREDESARIRIEVLKALPSGAFDTRVFIQQKVVLQPAYGESEDTEDTFDAWVGYRDFPWTNGETVDQALEQALIWLEERWSDRKTEG